MKLIQVSRGLLEAENFFLSSDLSDFAGTSVVQRNIAEGTVNLVDNNKLERNFPYSEFVIEVGKSNPPMGVNDYIQLYVCNDEYTAGIRETKSSEPCAYWKLIMYDGYLQAYASNDDTNYNNIGGMSFPHTITKQGFSKYSDNNEDFIINRYNLYSSPYLTIQNLDEGYLCEMYNSSTNELIQSKAFDSNKECRIFLGTSSIPAYLVFKDNNNNTIYTTDSNLFGYGDTWVMSPYNFEILYLGSVVTDINPAMLQDLNEIVSIKNVGSTDYTGVVIGTTTSSNDLIQLSLDGTTFSSNISVDLAQGAEVQVYIKITKNVDNHNFKVRDFQLVINE